MKRLFYVCTFNIRFTRRKTTWYEQFLFKRDLFLVKEINLFWFKRDLRLEDNPALTKAVQAGKPLLLIYVFEPSLIHDPHYSAKHFNFIKETLSGLQRQLNNFQAELHLFEGEVVEILDSIQSKFNISNLFSTLEIGLTITHRRDNLVKKWCSQEDVNWIEDLQYPVFRGLKNRLSWRKDIMEFMLGELNIFDPQCRFIEKSELQLSSFVADGDYLKTKDHLLQKGGRNEGSRYVESFFKGRIKNYSIHLSKPELSRSGCSRLSPYFAWGCFSIREIYQRALEEKKQSPWGKQLNAFMSRLVWQSHFIQKFESETRMEFEPINKAFGKLNQPHKPEFVNAWKEGKTGYPLIDAAMRCVVKTGYLNFRLRAMVVSFLTHHLNQPFTSGSAFLAQHFLDFEPGIHYPQFQMQAGLTGINIVRVYNPTLNAQKHDGDASFIKSHLPELADLPNAFAIEPWKLTAFEEMMYSFNYGIDYPKQIVDIAETRKKALDPLYKLRETELGKKEIARILDLHTLHLSGNRIP